MKRTLQILVVLLLLVSAVKVWAEDDKEKKKAKKPVPVAVYLGNSTIDSGLVTKSLFDSLLKQGLTSRDSNGRVFDVKSFMFTFCERNLYEDSVGNLQIMTDYLSEITFDSKLIDYQLNALLQRAKTGDTVIFEKIMLHAADSTKAGAYGKPMRLIIAK